MRGGETSGSRTPSFSSEEQPLNRPLLVLLLIVLIPVVEASSAQDPVSDTNQSTRVTEIPDRFTRVESQLFEWVISPGVGDPSESLSRLVRNNLIHLRNWLGSSSTRKPQVFLVNSNQGLNQVLEMLGGQEVPEWVPAVALTGRGIIIIDNGYLQRSPLEGSATVVHELAHLVLFEAGGKIPRWVHEGIAQWAAKQRPDPSVRRKLILLAKAQALVPITELDLFLPETHVRASLLYAEAISFIDWSVKKYGDDLHRRILHRCRAGEEWQVAFEGETGITLQEATSKWSGDLARSDLYLGLFLDMVLSWQALAILVVVAALVQRNRRRRQLARMEEDEWQSPRFPTSDGQNRMEPSDDID